MGHSAKFCAYLVIHIGSQLIPDFQLQQSSESISSVAMERDACEELLARMTKCG